MTFALMLAATFFGSARAESPEAVAGSVVRSKEWIVRRGAAREEEFVGDVRYESGGTRLTADWALLRHAQRDWKARGTVTVRKVLQSGDVITGRGNTARYSEKSLDGALEPAPGARVTLTRVSALDPDSPDRGEGDHLTWHGDQSAVLSGRARVWGPRLEAWADAARYDRTARELSLEGGRPVLRKVDPDGGWTTALKADRITAYDDVRRVSATGGVKGWIIFRDEKRLHQEYSR